jgi:hypothetical protein
MAKFAKGQSGNPGGKIKSRDLRELLRGYVPAAAKRLGELLDHKNPRVALLAIQTLYDRVYGRPLQASEVTIEDNRSGLGDITSLTPDEVAISLKELLTTAEKEMGLEPMPLHSNKDRVERLLQQPTPLSPSLYAALHQAEGTRH